MCRLKTWTSLIRGIWVKMDDKAGIKFAIILNTRYDVYSLKSKLL